VETDVHHLLICTSLSTCRYEVTVALSHNRAARESAARRVPRLSSPLGSTLIHVDFPSLNETLSHTERSGFPKHTAHGLRT
jgi:hypothetical protein